MIDEIKYDKYIKFFLIILSYIFGYVSFKFIEIPFRRKNYKAFNFFYYFIFIVTLLILIFVYFSKEIKKKSTSNIYLNYPNINFEILPLNQKIHYELKPFSTNNKRKFLIIGDSHAFDFYKILVSSTQLNKINEFKYLENEIHNYFKNKKEIEEQSVFKDSEFIILTNDYTQKDISLLESLIIELKNKIKKLF